MPTDTSTNFARYVHARHFPSSQKNYKQLLNKVYDDYRDLPCDETALDRAKSILFATIITGRVRIKSKS